MPGKIFRKNSDSPLLLVVAWLVVVTTGLSNGVTSRFKWPTAIGISSLMPGVT
jgi:hypothetical protein